MLFVMKEQELQEIIQIVLIYKCIGIFKPLDDANPYIGEKNKLEFVEEEKLEVRCDVSIIKRVLKRLREVYPYEEPAMDIIPLIEEDDL